MSARELRLALLQTAPVLRDPERNIAAVSEAARASGADLVLTPELSLTGYDVGDDAPALAREPGEVAARFAGGPDVIVGMIERAGDGVPYNLAMHVRDGRPLFTHRKIYLPTYGMFDEGRYFGRGRRIRAYDAGGGWRLGLIVCEDFWHPALPYVLAAQGIHALLVQSAGPGRNAITAAADGAARFASTEVWQRFARTTAQLYGIYVALAMRVGVEGALVFGGGSVIAGPDGAIVASAAEEGEAQLKATLSLDEVERARRPYAHGRDDDPWLTIRELRHALEREGA